MTEYEKQMIEEQKKQTKFLEVLAYDATRRCGVKIYDDLFDEDKESKKESYFLERQARWLKEKPVIYDRLHEMNKHHQKEDKNDRSDSSTDNDNRRLNSNI